MASERMVQKLNEQINREFYSAYLYLAMEMYLAEKNLSGFANFFSVQAQEERDHARMFLNYIVKVGGKVQLKQIDTPQVDFKSLEELFETALHHEQFVTKSIYGLVDTALEERDHTTNTFLQWFINEQAEEEGTADHNLKRLKLVGNDGKGILMIDAELAQRVYIPLVNANSNKVQ